MSSMTEIFLLRHGETEWNAEGRFQGQRDSSLTACGREQAGQLGRILSRTFAGARVPPFHVSPLGRTRDTAAIVGRHLNASGTMCVEPRLQDVSTGVWDGLTREAIEAGWPGALDGTDHFDWYFRSPDGETLEAALERTRSWLSELEDPVVAVSHGLLGRLIRGAWLGLPAKEMLCLPVPQDVVWHLSSAGVCPINAAASVPEPTPAAG